MKIAFVKKAGICCALLALLAQAPGEVQGDSGKYTGLEDKVKSAFLYKFSKYVQWPDLDASQDFKIAVLGDSPLLPLLEEISGRPTDGKKIRVEHLRGVEEIGSCQILFIPAGEKERIDGILKKVAGRSILTVGESKGLAARGVAVNFVVVEGRLRFEINRRAAARAGLQISSELLKLAILVEGGPDNVQP